MQIIGWAQVNISPEMFGVLSALSLGSADFIARYTSKEFGEKLALLATFIVTLLVIYPFFAGENMEIVWSGRGGLVLILYGVMMTITMLLLYLSLARGPINIVAPIVAAHPVFVVLFAVLLGSRPGLIQWLLMCGIIFSIVLVIMGADIPEDQPGQSAPIKGYHKKSILIALGASVSYAVMVVSGQHATPLFGPAGVLWMGHVIALAVLMLIIARTTTLVLPGKFWGGMLVIQGGLNAAGFLFLLLGSQSAFPEVTAVISSEFSVVTILLAWIILRERMKLVQFLGVTLLFTCTAILTISS